MLQWPMRWILLAYVKIEETLIQLGWGGRRHVRGLGGPQGGEHRSAVARAPCTSTLLYSARAQDDPQEMERN